MRKHYFLSSKVSCKVCYVVAAVLCLAMFGSCNSSRRDATAFWKDKIVKPVTEQLAVVIEVREVNHDEFEMDYTYIKDDTYYYYLGPKDYPHFYRFADDEVLYVSKVSRELMRGAAGEKFYDIKYDDNMWVQYYAPLLGDDEDDYRFDSMKDTTIADVPYKVLRRDDKTMGHYDWETGEITPDFYHMVYLYNEQTKKLEYICATPFEDNEQGWKQEYYLTISHDVDEAMLQQLFDFDNPEYAEYSRHDDQHMIYSWSYSSEKPSELTDSVLDYPIVSLSGDTTTIREEEGWLLLDFWFIGCSGCIAWFDTLAYEQQTLGYRVLEKNGIKILSINALSDNREMISEIATERKVQDIAYHAKGLGDVFDMHIMPQYYLISPDKQIVYKSNHLGDYSDLQETMKSHRLK